MRPQDTQAMNETRIILTEANIKQRKRVFVDAPNADRCTAEVTLKDGSTSPCGRHRKIGTLCTQHAKIATP